MTRFFLCIAAVTISCFSYGQSADKEDFIKHIELENGSDLLKSLQKQHIVDSISQQTILLQLQHLKTGSTHQKQLLQDQIDSLKAVEQSRISIKNHKIDSLRKYVSGFHVMPFKDTLFYLFTKNGLLNVSERASMVSERIQSLAKLASFDSTLLSLVKNEESVDIVYENTTLFNISETEALWSESNPAALAETYKDRIASGIQQYRVSHNLITIAKK
ncbi:MAG: hypothetical protein H7259_03315 [Cytophagales bacterium]|nr:hypothetical protein [Cytophaga sp.]